MKGSWKQWTAAIQNSLRKNWGCPAQVVFHAQIAKEMGTFTMDDVINGIFEKLIRRHPHVFADTEVESVGK